jgi:lipoprotein LprG
MAPERLNAELGDADHRVDVYALACILYQSLTGERPFRGDGFAQIATAQLFTPPPQPSARLSSVPVAMDEVVAKGMAKDPGARFGTARELAEAARRALTTDERAVAPPKVHQPAPETRQSPIGYAPVAAPGYPTPRLPQPPPQTPPAHFYEPPSAKPSRRTPIILGIAALGVVALVAVTIFVFATGSTGSGGGNGTASSTTSSVPPGSLLKSVAVNLLAAKSVHTDMTVTGSIAGLPIKNLDGDATSSPLAGQGKMEIVFLGSQLNTDYVVVDGTLYATITPDVWTDMGPAADLFDPTLLLSPTVGLAALVTAFNDPKVTGNESINGVTTEKIEGTVSASAVNGLLPAVKATAPVPGVAWIDASTQQLVQLQLTPTSSSSIRVTLSDWGKPVTVVKPPGV